MKKTILIGLIGCCFYMTGSSQYQPLLTPNKSWDIFNVDYNGEIGAVPYNYGTRYTTSGDTVINDHSYFIFTEQEIIQDNEEPVFVAPFRLGRASIMHNLFMREDTSEQKVFKYFIDSETGEGAEVLLYDFGISVGDTLHNWRSEINTENYGDIDFICKDIYETQLEDGSTARVFEITNQGNPLIGDIMTEQIGGINLFFPWEGSLVSECVITDGVRLANLGYCASSEEQSYRPLLQDGARWNEYISLFPECNYTLEIVGDTTINGQIYKKIQEHPNCSFYIQEGEFRFLREDTTSRKVYEIFNNSTTENILYDFSLSAGDTFYYRDNSFLILDSISTTISNPFFCGDIQNNTVNLSIKNPKVYYWQSQSNPIIWVEGIGSLSGLFANTTSWGGGFTGGSTILCYSNNNINNLRYIYCEEVAPCKAEGLNVNNNEFLANQDLKIYPNPATQRLFIEYDATQYADLHCEIYNINGELVSSTSMLDDSSLDISSLTDGMYFVKVLSDKYVFLIQRFIKT